MNAVAFTIEELPAAKLDKHRRDLVSLLADAVASNASVGYVWPLDDGQFDASWRDWIAEVRAGQRYVLVARVAGAIAGCVHLIPCPKPNQPHRADVAKLLVHRRFGRQGIGRALMHAVEAKARALGRTLLTLDTRAASGAEALYRSEGWSVLGVMPGFALDPDGRMASCTYFYKHLA
jgi:GNAT superfamily N-acetyltransferase